MLKFYIARAVLFCSLQYTSKKFEWKQWFGQFGKGHNWQMQTHSSHKTTRGGTVAVLSTEQKRDRACQWYGHDYYTYLSAKMLFWSFLFNPWYVHLYTMYNWKKNNVLPGMVDKVFYIQSSQSQAFWYQSKDPSVILVIWLVREKVN